jgi:hypothetical protein
LREKASHAQRLQKTLEQANIKLETVLSDVMEPQARSASAAAIGDAKQCRHHKDLPCHSARLS